MASWGVRETFRDADRVYRRGLVLGLNLAELFLLLLFLLLLAVAAAASFWQKQEEQLREENAALLIERDDARDELAGLEAIKRRLEEADLSKDEITTLIAVTQDRERLQKEVDALSNIIDEQRPLNELGRKMKEILAVAGVGLERLEEEPELLRQALHDAGLIDRLEKENERLQQTVDEHARRIDVLASEKGLDPSCWYEEVTGDDGETREIPVFLFDIAVFDDYLIIRDRDVPPKFAAEKQMLPLEDVRFTTKLSDKEFLQMMLPIRRMGKEEKKIRDYSCVFFVQIWDKTSQGAKERWKTATETIIGRAFYRRTMTKGVPW